MRELNTLLTIEKFINLIGSLLANVMVKSNLFAQEHIELKKNALINYVEINFLPYESEGSNVNTANKAKGNSAKTPVGRNKEIISKMIEAINL